MKDAHIKACMKAIQMDGGAEDMHEGWALLCDKGIGGLADDVFNVTLRQATHCKAAVCTVCRCNSQAAPRFLTSLFPSPALLAAFTAHALRA